MIPLPQYIQIGQAQGWRSIAIGLLWPVVVSVVYLFSPCPSCHGVVAAQEILMWLDHQSHHGQAQGWCYNSICLSIRLKQIM